MNPKEVHNILRKNKMKIQEVPARAMYGYVGMNDQAAKTMGFPLHSHKILIDKNLQGLQKDKTIVHETVEEWEMKHGKPYWAAHKDATRAEKYVHTHKAKPKKFKEYIY